MYPQITSGGHASPGRRFQLVAVAQLVDSVGAHSAFVALQQTEALAHEGFARGILDSLNRILFEAHGSDFSFGLSLRRVESTVKALSVRQPWAELIISGKKRYELRSWRTSVPGRIWIHASRTVEQPYVELAGLNRASLTTGAFIGSVEIVACVPFTTSIAEELQEDGAFFGDVRNVTGFAWQLAVPERLPRPIPYQGSLGIFRVPAEVFNYQD